MPPRGNVPVLSANAARIIFRGQYSGKGKRPPLPRLYRFKGPLPQSLPMPPDICRAIWHKACAWGRAWSRRISGAQFGPHKGEGPEACRPIACRSYGARCYGGAYHTPRLFTVCSRSWFVLEENIGEHRENKETPYTPLLMGPPIRTRNPYSPNPRKLPH